MALIYTVQRGDNLSKIASKHGLSSWRDLYYAPENSAFRRKRPNPNHLHPGDEIVIPGIASPGDTTGTLAKGGSKNPVQATPTPNVSGLVTVMPDPRPHGVVIYAGRNSRRRGYGVFLKSRRVGYLIESRSAPVAFKNEARGERLYGVRGISKFAPKNVAATIPGLRRRQNPFPLYDPETGQRIGYAQREDVVNQRGTPQMANDSTGMFQGVANAFRRFYGGGHRIVSFDNVHDDFAEGGTEADTRENFFDALSSVQGSGLDFFAYSGHGSKTGLPSACIKHGNRDQGTSDLIDEIRRLVRSDGWVLLYACSTADSGGFAEYLSRRLPRMTVIGHRETGEGGANPRKYRIRNGVSQAMKDLLPADVREFWTRENLQRNSLYARLPFLSIEQIATELRSGS